MSEQTGGRALTARQVADRLGVNVATIYRMVKSGELNAIWVGGVIRVMPEDLEAFIRNAATPADAPRPGWPSRGA